MDDQDWAELEAAMNDSGAPDESAPSGDEQSLSLQDEPQFPDEQETAPETQEAVAESDQPTEAEAVDPVVHERIVELERQLAERDAAEAAKRDELAAKVEAYRQQQQFQAEQEDAETAAALEAELRAQGEDELADKMQERRNWLVQTRQEALVEARGSLSALEAVLLALEDRLPQDQLQVIAQDAEILANMPTREQKQQWLQYRRQASAQESTAVQQLQRQVRELQNQLEAQSRPIAADVVEGGRSGGGGSLAQQLEEATDFGSWFGTAKEAGVI